MDGSSLVSRQDNTSEPGSAVHALNFAVSQEFQQGLLVMVRP